MSSHDTPGERSLSSSTDELDNSSSKSPTSPDLLVQQEPLKTYPKAWPSCPNLSLQENIWQMRPNIERRKRPSSLYHVRYSNGSPRGSTYSPRSSGYWSELEQLSESESFVNSTPKHPTEIHPLRKSPLLRTSSDDCKVVQKPDKS